jgi:hypothetical protein
MSPTQRAGNAARQRAHKLRQAEAGLVQVNVWVPAGAVADIQRAAEIIRQHPQLTIGRLTNPDNGRLVGLKKPKL